MTLMQRISARAFAPADPAGLVAFRFMFGFVMLADFLRYLTAGWVYSLYVEPQFLFKYYGFSWVEPLSYPGMIALFVAMMLGGVAMAFGYRYRLAAWFLFFGHTYAFLLAATHYLNHAYLLSVIMLLMAVLPVDRVLSLDAIRRPARRRSWVPAWSQWLLRIQLGIVYIYGGIAKINPDWLAGEPARGWMHNRAKTAPGFIGDFLDSELGTGFIVQGGLWFDLLIAPALMWRRTRWIAVLASASFHLSNAYLFNIGIFPWFMLVATTLFFEPDWPRKLPVIGPWIDKRLGPVPSGSGTAVAGADGVSEAETSDSGDDSEDSDSAAAEDTSVSAGAPEPVEPPGASPWVLRLIAGWLAVQVLLPLRHHLYPGNVAWTEQGHYFSWRMKLRSKHGSARFIVHAPSTGETWAVNPQDELNARQTKKMAAKPDLILQYAHHLAERWREEHGLEVEVRARVMSSLNRRRRQQLIDPTVDLSKVELSFQTADWIMPAPTEPVPGPRSE